MLISLGSWCPNANSPVYECSTSEHISHTFNFICIVVSTCKLPALCHDAEHQFKALVACLRCKTHRKAGNKLRWRKWKIVYCNREEGREACICATATSRLQKRETQDAVGFSDCCIWKQKAHVAESMRQRNSSGINQVCLYREKCKQMTVVETNAIANRPHKQTSSHKVRVVLLCLGLLVLEICKEPP